MMFCISRALSLRLWNFVVVKFPGWNEWIMVSLYKCCVQVTPSSTMKTLIAVASTRLHRLKLASSKHSLHRPRLPWQPHQLRLQEAITRHCVKSDGLIVRVPWCQHDRRHWRRAGPYRLTGHYHCWHPTPLSRASLLTRSPTRYYSRCTLSLSICLSVVLMLILL